MKWEYWVASVRCKTKQYAILHQWITEKFIIFLDANMQPVHADDVFIDNSFCLSTVDEYYRQK